MFHYLRKYSFTFFIPSLATALSFGMRASAGPFWINCDPSYMYLFNALHMIKGITPTFLDNPGTPLQILILYTIQLLNIGHSALDTLNKVLLNPEFYLYIVYALLVFSSFVTSVLLASYTYHKTQDKRVALLTQLPWLSFFFLRAFETKLAVLPVINHVGAENMLISIINLFNLCFLRLFFTKTKREEFLAVIFLGLICGVGFATKLTFLPLLLTGLLIVPWRTKLIFLIGVVIAFVMGTYPVIQKYPVLFNCIKLYAVHTGHYSSGPTGFINWPDFIKAFQTIVTHYGFFAFSTFGLLIWSTLQIFKSKDNRSARFLWAAALGSLIQYCITAKHFSFHYLLPGLGLFSSIFVLFYLSLKIPTVLLKRATTLFISIFIAFCVWQHVTYSQKMSVLSTDIVHLNKKILSKYPNALIIPTSTVASNIYVSAMHGLFFGNYASVHKENEELTNLYPHHYYFDTEMTDPWEREDGYGIRDFYAQRVFGEDLLTLNIPIIFIKFGSDFSEYALDVRLVEKSKYLSAFLLRNSTEKQAYNLLLASQTFLQKGQYQEALITAFKAKELNFQPKGKVDYMIGLIYHHLHPEGP